LGGPGGMHQGKIKNTYHEIENVFLKHFESITQKSNKYTFKGNIDVVLGDKKKIHLDGYSLVIEIILLSLSHFAKSPTLISLVIGIKMDFFISFMFYKFNLNFKIPLQLPFHEVTKPFI
jgi:hypothetical protein